ncbi:MAG: flavodoxin family protein [Clostridia bacterium]|nr:flavodoxin family protein [Clostridia bacterium]
MRCFVLFGSPHKNGNTVRLLNDFLKKERISEYDIVFAYDISLSPCTDCGGCRKDGSCVKTDFNIVKSIYEKIVSADIFVLASPVYFNSAPAPLKCAIDRMQPFYIKKFVLGDRTKKKPRGVLILSGGEKEREGKREMLKEQFKYVFDVFGFEISEYIYAAGADAEE